MKAFLGKAEQRNWPEQMRVVRDGARNDCLQAMLRAIQNLRKLLLFICGYVLIIKDCLMKSLCM